MSYAKLIVFEGPEGVGKSTQVGLATAYLESVLGSGVRNVFAPGYSGIPLNVDVRRMLFQQSYSKSLDGTQQSLLFFLDFYTLAKHVEDALARGIHVVSDRWTYSQYAYDTVRKNPNPDITKLFRKYELKGAVKPDAVILLDYDPGIGVRRANQRKGKSVVQDDKQWGSVDDQIKLRKYYLHRATGADRGLRKYYLHRATRADRGLYPYPHPRWYLVCPGPNASPESVFNLHIRPILREVIGV